MGVGDSMILGDIITVVCMYHEGDRIFLEDMMRSLPQDIQLVLCETKPAKKDMLVIKGKNEKIVIAEYYYKPETDFLGKPTVFDFSKARNRIKELAETEWVLMIDADERLLAHQDKLLRKMLTEVTDRDGGLLTINLGWTSRALDVMPIPYATYQCKIFRNKYTYKNIVHEDLTADIIKSGKRLMGCPLVVHHEGYESNLKLNIKRYERNLVCMLSEKRLNKYIGQLFRRDAIAYMAILGKKMKTKNLQQIKKRIRREICLHRAII